MKESNLPTLKDVLRAFGIYPSHAAALEMKGILPVRPHRGMSIEYIVALAAHLQRTMGFLRGEGKELLASVTEEKSE